MTTTEKFSAVIAAGLAIRPIEEGIYSVLPDAPQSHLYDRRSVVYDLVVGTRLYNRVMWGAAMSDYFQFGQLAVTSHPTEILLDAGCGSLLFTASAYLDSKRPILAFDQSLHMLRRGRARLIKLAGFVPERIFFLQADLSALPFRPGSFQTVLCMNVLHHLADAAGLITGLQRLLVDGGKLYLTSLVKSNHLIGNHYLDALYRRGDFVQPRTGAEVGHLMTASFGASANYRVQGNMAYASALSSIQYLQTHSGVN